MSRLKNILQAFNLRFRSWSLHTRLLAALLLPLALGFLALLILGRQQMYASEERVIGSDQRLVTASITQRISTFLETLPDTTITISNNTSLVSLLEADHVLDHAAATASEEELADARVRFAEATADLGTEIFQVVRRSTVIQAIGLFDSQGRELLRVERTGMDDVTRIVLPNELRDVSGQTYFQATRSLPQYQVHITAPEIDRDRAVVHLVTSLYAGGDWHGGIMVDVQAEAFLNYVSGPDVLAGLPESSRYLLVDSRGMVLADTLGDTPGTGYQYGQDGTETPIADRAPALAGLVGTDQLAANLGDVIATAATFQPFPAAVENTPWTLLVAQDVDVALSGVDRFGAVFALGALLTAGLLAVLLYGISLMLVRPLQTAVAVADRISAGDLSARVPAETSDEVGRLGKAMNSMTNRLLVTIQSLEERFQERTRDLEVASEIATVAVGMGDLRPLLDSAVNLIRERFNFYHVQVFLVDDKDAVARLAASTGEVGQKMLQEGWFLPVGSQSVIGQATATGKTVIASDTGETGVVHRPNPNLPDTRSEMAVPLRYGELVIGALDIQSIYPNAFSAEDVRIFEILSNQLTIAINNARLLDTSRQQIARVEELNRRLTRTAWDDFLTTERTLPTTYSAESGGSRGADLDASASQHLLSVPLSVRGEVIGTLQTAPSGEAGFGADEVALINAVAERVSLAVENARLVTETQRSLTETERLYQAGQAINRGASEREILEAIHANFGAPGRATSLIVFGQERDSEGYPLEARQFTIGAPGVRGVQEQVVPIQGPARVLYRQTATVHVLPTPDDIRRLYPSTLIDDVLETGIQSMASLPLDADGIRLGRLVLSHYFEPYDFSAREIEIFEALTAQMATVLRSRQLFSAVETERQTLQSILSTMPTAVTVIDAHTGRAILSNERAVELLGEEVDLVRLASEGRVIRADSAEPYPVEEIPVMQAIRQDSAAFTEDMSIIVDGRTIDVLNNAAPIHDADGNVTAIVAVFEDITELRQLQSALQDTLRETTAMYEASKAIFAGQDVQSITETVLTSLTINIMPDVAHLIMMGSAGNTLADLLQVVGAYPPEAQDSQPYPPRLFQMDRLMSIHASAPSLDAADRSALEQHHLASVVSVPMRVAGDVVGWLAFGYHEPHQIEPEEERLIEALSDQAAVSLQNTRLKEQTEEALSQTLLLYNASREISRATTIQQVLDVFVSYALPSEANQAAILVVEGPEELHNLQVYALWGHDPERANRIVEQLLLRRETIFPEDVFDRDQPIIIEDFAVRAALDEVLAQNFDPAELPAAVTLLPMRVAERFLGFLQISYSSVYTHHENVMRNYQALVDQVASAVENRRLFERTQESLDETRVLYETSSAIADVNTPQDILRTLVEYATPEPVAVAQLLLLRGEDWSSPAASMEIAAMWSREPGLDLTGMVFTPDQYPGWAELASGLLMHIDDVETDLRISDESRLSYQALNVQALALVPLEVAGRPIGALLFGSPERRTHNEREMRIYGSLAELTTIALENIRLLDQTRSRARQLQTSAEVSRAVTSILDINELLPRVVDLIRDNFGYDHVQVFLLNAARDSAVLKASTGEVGRTMIDLNWALAVGSDSVIGQVTSRAVPVVALDTADAKVVHRPNPYLPDTRSELAVPLISRGQVAGALDVQSNRSGAFSEEDITVLSSLADQIAIALDNARLFEETQDYTLALSEQVHSLQGLLDASQGFTSMYEADDILQSAAHYLVELMGVDHSGIVIADEADPQIGVVRAEYPDTGTVGVRIRMLGPWWDEGDHGTDPFIVPDVAESDALAEDTREVLLANNVQEIVILPFMVSEGRATGTIGLDLNKPGREFTPEDITLLQLFATQVATAYQNALLFQGQQAAARALEQQVNRMESLFTTSQTIGAIRDPESILTLVVEQLQKVLTADNVSIAIFNEDLSGGRVSASFPHTEYVGWNITRNGLYYVDRLLEQRGPYVVSNVAAEDGFKPSLRESLAEQGIRSIAFAPLEAGERLFGSIGVDSYALRDFSRDEITLLQLFATQVSTAYDNARLFDASERAARALEQQVTRMERLYVTSLALTKTLDLRELLVTGLKGLVETLGADFGTVLMINAENSGVADVVAWEGRQEPATSRLVIEDSPFYAQMIETGRPCAIDDLASSDLLGEQLKSSMLDYGVKALLIAPLFVHNKMVGAFTLDMMTTYPYSPAELTLVQTLTTQVSLAYENAELFVQAQRQAEDMSFLFNVTTAAAAYSDMESSMESVTELVNQNLPSDVVVVYIKEREEKYLRQVSLVRQVADLFVPQRLPLDSRLVEQAGTERWPFPVADLQDAALHGQVVPGMRSLVVVPLLAGSGLVGVMMLYRRGLRAYNEANLRLLQALSGSLSAVVQNIRLLEEVQAANDRLRELDKIKSQFLANMSHELRTPLNSIIGFSRVILKGIDGPLSDMQKQDLTTIHSSGQHLLNLINDILDQAKIEADKLTINADWFNIQGVVDVAKSMSIGLLKERPIRLNIEMESDLPNVFGDEVRTRQVLINLLSNASKFTHEGSITISVFKVEQADGPYVQVSVVDTGIGIPDNMLDVIFRAFEQVDGSLTRTSGGTGLGLPISRSLIEMMGGDLWVESTLNVGSNFSFTIPAFPKSTKASNPEQPDLENDPLKSEAQLPVTEQVLPPRKIVLVIDDEVGMHQLYRRYLNKAGYTVEATSNPDIAEEMVRLIKPQIIILDVRMPNRDGWDVLTKLKALQDTAAIPVVVISIDPDRERALQLGAVEYLNKPFLEEDLLKALVRVETEQAQDRILIVDDRPETVRMIGEWLRTNSPYEIVTATSGEEGLAQIARRLPSLVLLDLYMPDMSGLEMLARLRSDPVTRSLPVILITAEDDLIPIARGQYGDVSILSKNALDEGQLLTGVAAVLGHNAGDNRN